MDSQKVQEPQGMELKNSKWLPLLLALLVIAVGAAYFTFLPHGEKSNGVPVTRVPYVNEKGEHWGPLPKRPYDFSVASAANAKLPVKIVEGNIDPPDVHVGDIQRFRIVVESEAGIARVTAFIRTDTGTTTVELARSKEAAVAPNALASIYHVVEGKLVVGKADKNIAGEAAEVGGQEVWIGEWKVRDTHDTTYRTTFVAYDATGNKDTLTLAWSDLCGIPLGGNWGMTANNGGLACTVGAGTIDGIDNGNVTVDANTLTVNGTFVWNSGRSITIISPGKIVIGSGGKIVKGDLYMTDADIDGYPSTLTQSTSTSAGARRRYLLSTWTTDCNDASASLNALQTGYIDSDGDGYPGTYVSNGCYTAAQISAGSTDCNDSNISLNVTRSGYIDNDGDGYPGTYVSGCYTAAQLSAGSSDCNDSAYGYYYGTSLTGSCTVYNECSNSCTGSQSNYCQSNGTYAGWSACGGCTPAACGTYGYLDYDKDGYGAGAYGYYAPSASYNIVANNNDCDDSTGSIILGSTRTRYQSSALACGTACTSENQTCGAGGVWSGSYTGTSCTASTRTAYQALTSACGTYGSASEGQTCQTSGSWSGTYTLTSPPSASTRTMYLSSSVCGPATCTSESQTCQSSGSWSGTYVNASCSVQTPVSYYSDLDGDGYGAGTVQGSTCASIPSGYVSNNTDCYNNNANAKPGQTSYFTSHRGDYSFDYNCDGTEQHFYTICPDGAALNALPGAYVFTEGWGCKYVNWTATCSISMITPTAPYCGGVYYYHYYPTYSNSSCTIGTGSYLQGTYFDPLKCR